MSVCTACPDCGRAYNLADRLLGKTIRCKECGHTFRVEEVPDRKEPERARRNTRPEQRSSRHERPDRPEDDEDNGPRRRRRTVEDDRSRRPRRKASSSGLWIPLAVGGGVLLVLLFGAALFLGNRFRSRQAPSDQPGSSAAQSSPQQQGSPPPTAPTVPWTVEPDPAPPAEKRLAAHPIHLPAGSEDILDITFTRPDVGQAVVIDSVPLKPPSPQCQVRADRLDLVTGRSLGSVNLYTAANLKQVKLPFPIPGGVMKGASGARAEVSPDGAQLLLQQGSHHDTLELWDLSGGKSLTSWQPQSGEKLLWFAFLDLNRVLTATKKNLTLWQMPEKKVLYSREGDLGLPGLSPTRKYIALAVNQRLELLEAATGAVKGVLHAPDTPEGFKIGTYPSPTFSPDGKHLVAGLMRVPIFRLGHWDLTSGACLGSVAARIDLPPLVVTSARSLFLGRTLYDWDFQAPVWEYDLGTGALVARASPDDRVWVARSGASGHVLQAEAMPDREAAGFLQQLAAGQAQLVLTQGTPVEVVVSSGEAALDGEISQSLGDCLRRKGFNVGPGGPTLKATLRESSTGRTTTYQTQSLDNGQVGSMSAGERVFEVQVALTDSTGTELYQSRETITPPDRIVFSGGDINRGLQEELRHQVNLWALNLKLPSCLVRINGQVHPLPRQSRLFSG